MKATYDTGLEGERIAEEYLTKKGMQCLERRYREKCGEIDLIMRDGESLVFVEVKSRFSSSRPGTGISAVQYGKQRRIARAAAMYMMKHKLMNSFCRFDVVEVNREGVIHIPNAFQPGGYF